MSEYKPIYSSSFSRLQAALWTFVLLVGIGMPVPVDAAVCLTAPSLSLDSSGKYSAAGEYVDYSVTVTNEDAGICDFVISSAGDDASFTSAIIGSPLSGIAAGGDGVVTLRVTVVDGTADWTAHGTTVSSDAGGSVVATTTVFDNEPLLHNSVNLSSSKHGGNWGSTKAGSKYGSITCETCHIKDTTNIKKVRTSITTPDNSLGSFPGDGEAISFQSSDDGNADMGDDSGAHATSNRVCEVCHTYDATGANGVKYHAYDMSAGGAYLNHYNGADCVSCHKHKEGFKATCSVCHGGGTEGSAEANFWPDGSTANAENDTPGLHQTHMNILAQRFGETYTSILDTGSSVEQAELCGYCHDDPGGGGHIDGTAQTAFHPIWDKAAAASGSYLAGNCTNICHNNKPTGAGVGTYGWDGDQSSACIMCHNNVTAVAGGATYNTHNRHLNLAADFGPSLGCDDCHDGATDWSGGTPPGSNHINGTLNIAGSRVVSDEYTGSSIPGANFGSCSGGASPNSCHSDGAGGAPARAYTWGSTLTNDCASCHAGLPTSGSHPTHVNTAETSFGGGANWATNNSVLANYDFGCGNCHSSTKSNHLNGSVTVTGVGYGAPTANQCSSNNCHQDGKGAAPLLAPTWGTPFTAGECDQCHGNFPTSDAHPQHTLEVGFHYDAISSGLKDFLPVVDADPVPTGLTGAIDDLRGHGNPALETAGATAIVSCDTCHNYTVTVNTNMLATYADASAKTKACSECHNGGAADVNTGNAIIAIADKSYHVNGVINVKFTEKKIRSKAQVRDEKAYNVVPDTPQQGWTLTTELTSNWYRFNGYKEPDGSSYDETKESLHQMAADYWDAEAGNNFADPAKPEEDYYQTGIKTCLVACHLWESGRVDKIIPHWVNDSQANPTVSERLMCIDCHTRLPK